MQERERESGSWGQQAEAKREIHELIRKSADTNLESEVTSTWDAENALGERAKYVTKVALLERRTEKSIN